MAQEDKVGIRCFETAIPKALLDQSGAVFCSGKEAFSRPATAYVLGYNPGGDPETMREHTLRSHTRSVLSNTPDRWSEFVDQSWASQKVNQNCNFVCSTTYRS